MYRAYQPTVPTTNLYLQEKWDRSRYEEHRRKLLMAVPAVNTKGLQAPAHLIINMKKIQMERERQEQIDKQNQSHYAKLGTIRASQGRLDNWNNYPHRSLNLGSRMRNLEEITVENAKMLGRILRRESEYRKWESEWEKVEKLRAQICHYPRISVPTWGGYPRVAFQNLRRNSSILELMERNETKRKSGLSALENNSGRTSLGSTRASSVVSDKTPRVLSSVQSGKSERMSLIKESTDYDTDRKSPCHEGKPVTLESRSHLWQKNSFRSRRNSNKEENLISKDKNTAYPSNRSKRLSLESRSKTSLSEEVQTEKEGQQLNKREMVSSTISESNTSSDESDQDSYFSLVEFEESSPHSPHNTKKRSIPLTETRDSQGSSLLCSKSQDSLESSLSRTESQGSLLQSSEFLDSQRSPFPLTESQDSRGNDLPGIGSRVSQTNHLPPAEYRESNGCPHTQKESQDIQGSPRPPMEFQDSQGSRRPPKEPQDSQESPHPPSQSQSCQGSPCLPTESRDSQVSPTSPIESHRSSEAISSLSQNMNTRGVHMVVTTQAPKKSPEMSLNDDIEAFVSSTQGSKNNLGLSPQEILLSEGRKKPGSFLEDCSEAFSPISNRNINPSLKAFSRSSVSSFEN